MKLSNHIQSPNRLTQEQKQLIESFFWGENSKSFTDVKGVVLNKTWQISVLTGIQDYKVERYLNRLIKLKREKLNEN